MSYLSKCVHMYVYIVCMCVQCVLSSSLFCLPPSSSSPPPPPPPRSYGVLLWEIMTLGRNPYPGVENRELLEQLEEKGLKLSKPKPCPPDM